MKEKPKIWYRIAAFFFAGSIMTATLTGCMYGPPPQRPQSAIDPEKGQNSEVALVVHSNDKHDI